MSDQRIVVDEIMRWPTKIRCFQAGSCHLTVEPDEHGQYDLERLHAFAKDIGMRRAWFQPDPIMPHYDLTPSRRELALATGAVYVPWREQATRRRAARKAMAPVVGRMWHDG